MPPRFYVPEARATERAIVLPDDEAVHLTRVLRLTSGDRVRVFNGRGDEWHATVESAAKHRVTVTLAERVAPPPEPRIALTLAPAVLKGDKMDDVVRDAVMLGASALQPVITARTEIAASAIERSGRIDRWQRIAIASAKQCGRAVVPPVRPALRVESLLDGGGRNAGSAPRGAMMVMLIEPGAAAAATPLRQLSSPPEATLLVGPEGGWTDEEVRDAASRGAVLVTLGAHTLRADAAPLVALTALRVWWDDF